MFETDKVPEGWPQRLNFMDEVWVPTTFARDIFAESGVNVDKLHVVGEAVDTDYFQFVSRAVARSAAEMQKLPRDLDELREIGHSKFSVAY